MDYGGGYEAYGNDDYGGGGFMDTSSQGASQNTPNKGRGGRVNRDAQTLMPVTIHQVLNRTDNDDLIRIDGHDVTNVQIIGIISNVMPHSTNVHFHLDDGTGTMDARMFLHSDDLDAAEAEIAKLR